MEIFSEAVELTSAAERAAYLDRACGGDPALRCRVEGLLGVHGQADGFLESPAAPPTITAAPTQTEDAGTVIGLYKLMEPIGEGGMGVVYVAEQTKPVRRKVALKIIKPGMDTKQVIARFEAERQALAMMDHPNIAKVHDAGATESGRPYFVMELVRGIPITDYCDREQLSIPERLELFVLVCRAVQHAHQKGVIHRDLKPSNILVTLVDGAAVPKVIDFGVAKATGASLTERTIYTAFHQFVGTPLYMSPEQADLAGVDVDTRSDIYSLGVLLYELLTGSTPFDQETLRKAAFDEVRRMIREQEPPKPSTRLSSLGDPLTAVSANRKADPRHLGRSMRGELDWIVMRALEKDRRRRYETANNFAADVMRYLNDQPVEACPPSARYRFSKYVRRHRASLTTVALVGLALVAGTAVSVWQAIRATAAEHRAIAAQARAEDHLVLARQAVDELYDQVAARWTNNLRWAPLPRPFLEKALPFYERFAGSRQVDAATGRANKQIGEILIQLGRGWEAGQAIGRATAVFRALRAIDPENSEHLHDLAACHAALAEISADDAVTAISLREDLVARHPGVASYRKELANSYHLLGVVYWGKRRPRADEFLHRALEIQERLCADEPVDPDRRSALGMTLRDLGNVYRDLFGRFDEAERYHRRALAIHDELVARHPTRPQFWLELGWSCWELGRLLVAAQKYGEVPKFSGRAATIFEGLANEYPAVIDFRRFQAQGLADIARAQFQTGHRAEAEQALRRLEGTGEDSYIADQLAFIAGDLGYSNNPKFYHPAEAMMLTQRSLKLRPEGSPFITHCLGASYYKAGDIDAAIRQLELALIQLKGDLHLGTGFFLAMAYHRKGDHEKARAWYDRSVKWLEEREPSDRFLLQFRADAAAVLGMKDTPAKGAKPTDAPTGPK